MNRWTRTADLTAARAGACAAVLNDGRLLIAGGIGASGPVAAVDIYGTDGAFSAAAPMTHARAQSACVTLPDGRVLAAGGNDGSGSLNSAEIFDPSINQWQPTGNMLVAREGHRMAMTSWGFAWVAGGTSNGVMTGAMELFNPSSGQFQTIGALNTPRAEFAMTAAGRSLIIAGGTDGTNTLSSIEIYDSSLGSVTVAGAMSQARKDFAAAALLDGTILMTGGRDGNGSTLSSTEIFDPVKGTSSAGPALLAPRAYHSAYAMPQNGSVLIYGGAGDSGVLGTSELYAPWTGTIQQGSALNTARRDDAKATLRPGSYMIAGGRNDAGFLSASELFQFSTITTDKGDYAPGTAVKISGGGWIPGEQVLVTITAFPVDQHHIEFTGAAVADGAGNITVPGFAVDKSHLGMKFLMTAAGSQSQAETTFTDGIDPIISYAFNPANDGTAAPNTAVAVTVTLTPPGSGDPTPTGNIVPCANGACPPATFIVTGATCNPSLICSLAPGSANTATATFSITIPAGSTQISIEYEGDSNYNSEVPTGPPNPPPPPGAPIVTYTAQNFTVTDLTGGPASPATFGTQIPYVANVCITATSGGPCLGSGGLSGSVTFFVNGTQSGSPVPITRTGTNTGMGTANFIPNPPLAIGGPYVITATYGNDTSNSTSNSSAANGGAASITTTITGKATANFTITSSTTTNGQQVVAGSTVSLTATYSSNPLLTPPPTGTITFINTAVAGTPVICGPAVPVNGVATCTGTAPPPVAGSAPGLAIGPVTVGIVFGADSSYDLGSINAFGFTVVKAPTVTQLVASAVDGGGTFTYVGHTITLTATTTTQGLTYTPTGAITITVPPTNVLPGSSTCATPTPGPSTANSISASCSFTVTGPVPIAGVTVVASASYAGDAYTLGSPVAPATAQASMLLKQDVTTTTLTFTSTDNPTGTAPPANPTFIGHAVTLTATVTNVIASVQPNWNQIVITPPPGNVLPGSSTCATPTHVVALDTPTSVTVSCMFTVSGPLGSGTIFANASYAGDTPSGTAPSSTASPGVGIAIKSAATSTVLTATSDAPQPFEIGRTVTLSAVVTTTTPGATVQPTFANITITPPVGNSSHSTCGTPTAGATTPTSVTATCTFLLTGPLPAGGSVVANASYAASNTSGTAASAQAPPLTILVTPATTTTTLTASATPDLTSAVELGRVVTLTAAASTLATPVSGVSLAPAGNFVFTLPANGYIVQSCGTPSGGNTFTVTPTAANMSVLPYSATGPNQGVTTVTCSFAVVPPANGVSATGAVTYSVVYNNPATDPLTVTSSKSTGITAVMDATGLPACVSTSGGTCSQSSNVYTYGQTISFESSLCSATGLPADGSRYAPTQSISFSGGGLSFTTPIVPSLTPLSPLTCGAGQTNAGNASWNVPVFPTASTYNVTVSYPATDPYYQSASTAVTFTVNKAVTTTLLNALTVPAGVPNVQVIVYNSSPGVIGLGTPTGSVQLTLGGSVVTTGTLVPSGNCGSAAITSCGIALFKVATGSYVANYPGDNNFTASSSTMMGGGTAVTGVVASSSVSLSFSPSVASPGTPVTITAIVSGTNGNSGPTGSVSFTDNGVLIGVAPVQSNGSAVLTYTPGPGSSHTIVATYSGDATYPGSSFSSGLTLTKLTATTPSSVNGTATVYGQAVNLSVRVAAGSTQTTAPVPTGTVQFFVVNGSNIGMPVTLANGSATLPYTGLAPGTYTIGVTYSGDNTFNGFTSTLGTITVSKAQVTVALGTPTTSNGQMTLTATLTVVAPGAGTPTGTVSFNDAVTGATLGTGTVSNGVATATFAATNDPIVAVYSGDTNFLTATSAGTMPTTVTPLNAASDVAAFSADTIISLYGSGLTTQMASGSLPLPTTLGGITVTVTDSAGVARPAPLFFVSPGQINCLIPAGTAPGMATITVVTASGSLTTTVNITASSAALFTANNNGSGPLAAQVVAAAPGGQETYTNTATASGMTFVNAPISLSPAADTFYLLLYGTGFDSAKAVSVSINGQTYTPSYFGPQGGFAGLDQINVLLPAALAGSGQVNVSITVDGQTSNVGTIAFASAGTN